MRVLLALGGNAMTGADGRAHGNGPQVGNLLVKNELAAAVVPPVPLDWCGAQTQATLGFTLMNALDNELAARGLRRPSATVVTRTLVAADDPGLTRPTKPIGRFLPEAEARRLIEHGERWEACGEKGWRRMVGSPEPLEVLDGPAVRALVDAGYVVVANGGGGIPTVSEGGVLRGVEAVIDKDLGAALLARTVAADVLVVATDVPNAVLRYGTPEAEPLGEVAVSRMRQHLAEGHFSSGSMGPKVEAACRFVDQGGRFAAITELSRIRDAVAGEAGTVVVPD
jgi:carbamate kinase